MVGSDYGNWNEWIALMVMVVIDRDELFIDVNLTAWMFSRIEEMQNPTPVKSAAPAPAAPQQQTSSPKPNRIFAQAIGGLNGGSSSSSRRDQRDRSRSRSPEPRERRPRQRTPERARASSPSSSSSSFTILSRLGRSNDRQVSVASSDGKLDWMDMYMCVCVLIHTF